MKPIEHDTAIDWLKQTCIVIREMDAENKKLKEQLTDYSDALINIADYGETGKRNPQSIIAFKALDKYKAEILENK